MLFPYGPRSWIFAAIILPTSCAAFNVVGYMPEYRFGWEPERWDQASQHLTHIILFSLEVEKDGTLSALDRFPSKDQMQLIQEGKAKYGTKLLVCFGGHSRSRGFSDVVSSKSLRDRFVSNLVSFLDQHKLDGVDYNWEYPATEKDWRGLYELISSTKAALPKGGQVTMAYYPDTRQEKILSVLGFSDHIDLFFSMSYDRVPGKHSTLKLAKETVRNWDAEGLPRRKLCLGLPFYARHIETGEAKTYEEIHRTHKPLIPKSNGVGKFYFNGVKMISYKTKISMQGGLGGVMIWELGQDIPPSSPGSLLAAISLKMISYKTKISMVKSNTIYVF
eukprot:CAMPEP_0184503132 /NCGR_PEP_ID=MMETSP0113_2-20130426/51706_1 /TAXON_ID=91329 /ORGANISM="Norrisiella sphaerica, Strain BC52" /LENGTH=332 /DNA_ID=CAMNT_0026892569 /DNA_START=83 /DNA_END=1081 /DNA_ORIENTATION=+